jgi:aspartate carbamoyltransferase catalytic subunit
MYASLQTPRDLAKTDQNKDSRGNRPDVQKHLLSAKSLSVADVDRLCRTAEDYELGALPPADVIGKTVALLFFQPGCHPIGMENMAASRSNTRSGETLEDCAAVISRLSDLIVVRHHEVGAAERMARKSMKPVINGGDGWNEHPTQALIDIFSLRRGLGTIRGKSICFGGDPRGRTVRSLVQLLRFENPREIVFCPPPHYEVPADLLATLSEHQIRCRVVHDLDSPLRESDAIMMAPYDMSDIGEPAASGYVSPRMTPETHQLTAERILNANSNALIYHPMPRLDEIDPSCDDLPNAMYFEQVRLSKFMRMAVLGELLSIGNYTS